MNNIWRKVLVLATLKDDYQVLYFLPENERRDKDDHLWGGEDLSCCNLSSHRYSANRLMMDLGSHRRQLRRASPQYYYQLLDG